MGKLYQKYKQYFDQDIKDLPEYLKVSIKTDFFSHQWDYMTSSQRQNLVIKLDQNKPKKLDKETERIGMFHLAESLAKETGEPRISWLQNIARAISGMPGEGKKFFKFDYFILRGSAANETGVEGIGIVALKKLAEQNSFIEPKDIEEMLKTIWFPAEQVEAWRAELNLSKVGHPKLQKEIWEQDAKKILEEHNANKAIAVCLLLKKYGKYGTEKSRPYLQVSEAGVTIGIPGWPDAKDDKNGWRNYRGIVNRKVKKGERSLAENSKKL